MNLFIYHLHQETKSFKIISFGIEFEFMPLEKWDDNFQEILAVVDLVSIAILVVGPRIFLEIHAAAPEEFLQSIEDVLIAFDKLDIELWLNNCSPYRFLFFIDISNVDSEASFAIHEAHNVVWCKTMHFE